MKKFVISSVVALAFAVTASPSISAAQTTAELQAMIAALQAQLNALSGTTTTTVTSSYVNPGVTLRVGSKGVAVTALQNALNNLGFSAGKADGIFGQGTAAAVRAFQASKSLSADGVAGNATHGALTVALSGTTTTPTTPGTTGTLTGTVGMVKAVNNVSSGLSSKAAENTERKIFAFDIEADKGSDISIEALSLKLTPDAGHSVRLTKQVNEVIIYQDSTEVASVRSSDFNRVTSTNVHTANVSLSKNAVIKSGQKARFYVAVQGNSVIDSTDLANGWTIELTQVARYKDASGAILSQGVTGVTRSFVFESSVAADGVRLQTSPNSPTATNLKVDEDKVSDEYMPFAFRLKGDNNSGDVDILNLPVKVALTSTTSTAAKVIDDIYVKVGNNVFDNFTVTGGNSANAVYDFEIDEGDLRIGGADNTEVKVYVKFNSQETNYANGTKVAFSIVANDIVAENRAGDAIAFGGSSSITGEAHTLLVKGSNVTYVSDSSARVDADGRVVDFQLTFDVTAEGDDVVIDRTAFTTAGVQYSIKGGSTTGTAALTGNASLTGNNYTVYEGQTKRFTLTVTVTTTVTGPKSVELTAVKGTSVSNIETAARTVIQ